MVKSYIVVVSAIIFNDKGEVLIARRSDDEKYFPGYHCFPGGKVEEGLNTSDVLQVALKREVMEEVGIEVDVLEMINSHIGEFSERLFISFKCRYISGKARPLEDIGFVEWMRPENVSKLEKLSPMMVELIEKCLKK